MYYLSELTKLPLIKHGFSTVDEGNMSYVWGEQTTVNANRQRFLASLNIAPAACVTMSVQDKSILQVVNSADQGRGMFSLMDSLPVDGLITRERGLFLMLVVADCLPIIMLDRRQNILALLHAGWRSTEARITQQAARQLMAEFQSQPEDLSLFIGPAIHQDSFLFHEPFQKTLPNWQPFLNDTLDGATKIDLISYNMQQAKEAGLSPQNIFDSGVDTAADPHFFSHYRDSKLNPSPEGRFACVFGLI